MPRHSLPFPSMPLLACYLLLAVTLPVAAQAEDDAVTAVTLDRITSSGGGWGLKVSTGWEFEATADVQVTELGVWDTTGDGLDVDTPVKIWDADGKEVASAKVPKGAGATLMDSFRFTKIEPAKLTAGKRYVIATQYTPEHKDNMVGGGANFSLAAPLRWVAPRHQLTNEFVMPQKPADPRAEQPRMPGNFGPNFRIAKSDAARAVRTYHRVRFMPLTRKTELIIVPEQWDDSHRFDKYKTISLYALPDGKLTQVLFEDQPLGTGEDAFKALAKEIAKIKASKVGSPGTELEFAL